MLKIDINCDMGEGIGNDEAIMPWISSVNIACGYHAGDENIMRTTIELALKNNVAIGAHPSFFDKENFGRIEMNLSETEIYDLVLLQVRTIDRIVKRKKAKLHHVKPHGALYNMSAKDQHVARAIGQAVKDFDDTLILFGLSGSYSVIEAKKMGLKAAHEAFADRTYQDDGSLTSRSTRYALIEDVDKSVTQALQIAKEKTVTSLDGKKIPIEVETICIHGDGKNAIELARRISQIMRQNDIQIKAL
ncbi:MAG: LamB/YcsF family protein [Acidobacteria bacterium]|nr:MAG: LamB/YcsF family protein [Acidobacteriota bacterium]